MAPGRTHASPVPTSSRFLALALAIAFALTSTQRSIPFAAAQPISTNTPVPPLQWLNLTSLLQGAPPPALKYSSIGYDSTTDNVIIFGGQSSSGVATSETFLLNLGTLTWTTPTPQSDLPQGPPPARYMAVGGEDFSSSYRHAHLVMGGKDVNGDALSDVWEFDFINQFWSEVNLSPGGPSPRWSASGGRDFRVAYDAASTNNTFYLAGGTDGTQMFPLSDVWELSVSGALSANLANSVTGSWKSISPIGSQGVNTNQASTVVSSSIISVSGCNTTDASSDACAEGNSYLINTQAASEVAVPACPAPRYGGALVANMVGSSSAFPSQAFLLLGTFNSSEWDDQGGLERGEVAVLDYGAASWSRILPAGDPGQSGTPTYPTPREGAVALSFPSALVGNDQSVGSDTIVFGGETETGEYLSEVWVLRAYNASISQTNASWGAPDGDLQTGVNANGAGVTVQYMNQCAVSLMPSTTSPNPASSPGASGQTDTYDVSVTHKVLAPVSIALLFPAILVGRLALPSGQNGQSARRNTILVYSSVLILASAYGIGVIGLIFSFTSISSLMNVMKRSVSSNLTLQTAHGIAGLVLFIALYGFVPVLYLVSLYSSPRAVPEVKVDDYNNDPSGSRGTSTEHHEKLASPSNPSTPPQYPPTPTSPRARLHSWGGTSFWQGRTSHEGRRSVESEAPGSSSTPHKGFEVVNRPARTRRASTNGFSDAYQRVPVLPRSIGEVNWHDGRRSLNAVNELDHAGGSHSHYASNAPSPGPTDILSTRTLMHHHSAIPQVTYEFPSTFDLCLHITYHALVFALSVLSLFALWYRAPTAAFAVFLVWTVLFYCAVFALAWNGRPRRSALTTILARLRVDPSQQHAHAHEGSGEAPGSRSMSVNGLDQYPFPSDSRGPYMHHPPYRHSYRDDVSTTLGGPRSTETDEEEDGEDDETRQRRIEEEMGRRDVSIVTVPKRRLWITNPS
ncbi:hypothetical protein CONPUDRAFT_130456 [Coniophora puteana RWD-64-598 SS2]|uniref:Galactose oxidase n=1 Tax=Coniophora puteana (strain RWD-64-598) TaxID=741705 RepID=A0A5M3MA74_CONPW|nr:uncharacterized protein CONPUDRAFT_130456 [Coniophora puteana RWD-64-598 SS2]EIW76099.1 hypothetical protein CONPUDRAFT_130456 [Coniophora puteana RWD-64-598 SS2]